MVFLPSLMKKKKDFETYMEGGPYQSQHISDHHGSLHIKQLKIQLVIQSFLEKTMTAKYKYQLS